MSKLVDKERLAKLAAALDARAKAAVKAEEERAIQAEEGLQGAIDAINNAENGVLAQAKKYANDQDAAQKKVLDAEDQRIAGLVSSEEERAMGVEAGLQEAIDAINNETTGILAEAKKADGELETKLQGNIDGVAERVEVLEGEMDDAEGRLETIEANIEAIFGGEGVEIDLTQIGERIEAVESKATALEGRADDLESAVGKAADGEEEATGLYLAVANAQAKADQGVADAATEKARAEEQEAAIRGEFANADATLKSELQAEIDADVKVEADRAKAEEAKIRGEFAAADAALKTELQAEIDADVKKLADRHDDEMTAVENRVTALEGKFDGESSVENQIADALEEAKQYADDQDAALHTVISAEIDADVKVVADALADEKDVNKEGSLAAQIKAEKDRMNAFMTDADVQDKAIDTLKEIQQYINEHGEAAAEMVANIEAAQKAADDEKVRAEAAEAALSERIGEAAAEGKEATGLVKEIADEKARAMKEEADIRDEFAAADQAIVDAQKLVDEVQDNRIKALEDANKDGGAMAEAVKAAQDAADAAQEAADNAQEAADNAQSEVDAVELRVEALEAKHAANGEVDQKIKAVQDAVDVVEGRMDTAESEIDELQAFKDDHSHAQIEADIEALEGNKVDKEEGKSLVLDTEIAKIHEHANKAELDKFEENDKANLDAVVEFMNGHSHETMEQGIEDNAAAIAKEVNDRNAAIEAALEDYSTSDEVKAMLGAVVQSLSMELTDDDKLRLTLGEGVDGITLNEIELDMVTDADIDAIIAGLDTPAAE